MKPKLIRDTAVLLASILTAAPLPSCVVAHGNGASWTYAGMGADATGLDITGRGMKAAKLETSPALIKVAELVSKMWNAYLVQQGLQFIAGKYYNLQGKQLDATTSVKLEELRNAKSVTDANAALATLKETNRAAAVLP